jgi:hypothetical protein
MKTASLLICLLCAAAAAAQNAPVLTNQAQAIQMPSHDQHASQHELAPAQNLLGNASYYYAQGERPLWEFGPVSQPVPLGDIARAFRKEHAAARKAQRVLEK